MAKTYGLQKSVTVKLYPHEAKALEVLADLAGLDGKSGALREFMKSYIEAALVTIETRSPTRGTIKHIKNMQRFQQTMRSIQKNTTEQFIYPQTIETLKAGIA
tara:strand:+ start:106 stop:414 length:309 start_codon:yes stop_codon:yes gene_type:complete